jgi:hypothetical protein
MEDFHLTPMTPITAVALMLVLAIVLGTCACLVAIFEAEAVWETKGLFTSPSI